MERFKNCYLIAQFCKVCCTGQTCRSASNYSHFFTIKRLSFREPHTIFTTPIACKSLKFSYCYSLPFYAEYARAFTLALLRADSPANRRQGTVCSNYLCCLVKISIFNLSYKCWNIYAYGTCSNTFGALAIKTS
ncbi:hypothetical protein DSECCO2_504690 [anaerobic digester metagenome]